MPIFLDKAMGGFGNQQMEQTGLVRLLVFHQVFHLFFYLFFYLFFHWASGVDPFVETANINDIFKAHFL